MEKKYFYILISSFILLLILCGSVTYLEEIPPDTYLFLLINQKFAFETLDPFFIFGARALVYIPMIPAAWLFIRGDKNTKRIIILMLLAVFASRVVFEGLKNIIDRVRPYDYLENVRLIVDKRKTQSFPSGHAAIASTLTTFALYFKRDDGRKVNCLMILYLVAVAYSRVYVGVHYPLDVIGGILLSVSLSLGMIALYEYKFIDEKP